MRIPLRYGINPHQVPAELLLPSSGSPIRMLNGLPGYVNILDALNSWQLVKELREATGLPIVSSFKHVTPISTAVGYPLGEQGQKAYESTGLDQSLLACAFLRTRNVIREVRHQDFVAFSDPMDMPTAKLLARDSTLGIIAPAYEPKALSYLQEHKGEEFLIIEMDPFYEPEMMEERTVYGFVLKQSRNHFSTNELLHELQQNTGNLRLDHPHQVDALIALVTLKYSRSHAMCMAFNGQSIGIGAGQQSLGLSFHVASEMAQFWMLRQHPRILSLDFPLHMGPSEREALILDFIQKKFSAADRYSWLKAFQGLTLVSDGAEIEEKYLIEARRMGVTNLFLPQGDERNRETHLAICQDLGIRNFHTDVRFFHH